MAVTGLNLWIRELGEQDGETCGSIQTMDGVVQKDGRMVIYEENNVCGSKENC